MKLRFLLSCILLICIKANATPYYFSTSGNDANTGTTAASPFKTLAKLNTLVLNPGDSILFKCGDTFRGQINLIYSGTSSLPIVFTSYGSGAKPVISGAEPVTGWSVNGSVYQATFTQNMNNFFVNDKEQILARYPNDHQYLTLDSAQKFYLKDASITSIPSLVNNSKICIHTAQWCWEKTGVASVAGDKISFSSGVTIAAIANYGYFLYDNILHLDTAKEWKYDNTSKLITYMPQVGQNPNQQTCEGSVYLNGISIDTSSSYITIRGLSFEKQSNAGVAISGANNRFIKIDSCYFARQYNHGVSDRGKYNEVSNSYFREVDGIAVFVNGSASNSTIHHNIFRNIGEFRNSGIGTQINLSAIKTAFVDSAYIHHNDIDSAGYCGIAVDGKYHVVEKNIIKNVMLLNNDGAALKTYGVNSSFITFKNNFISTSDGNNEGTNNGSFITPAIYFDHESNNSIAQDNTIYNRTQRGILQNSGTKNNTTRGNTIYGFNFGIDLFSERAETNLPPITGMVVKDNKLFAVAATPTAIPIRQVSYDSTFNHGVIDSNYYYQPYNNFYAIRSFSAISPGPLLTFPQWRSTGNDTNTIIDNFTWAAGVDSSKIFLNPTDNAVVQDLLGWKWKDLDTNIVTTLTLQPWTSKIMIQTNVTNVSVTVNSVTKCSNDAAVTITATPLQTGTYNYVWTVPSGATNPGNVQSFSATVAGTYSVTITHQNSGTGSGSATLTVNPNPTVVVNSPVRCSTGAAVTITATPSPAGTYNYAWTVPSGVTNPGNVASFSATVAGTYTVVITNATTGCTGTGSGTLTVNPNPTVTVNSPAICATGSAGTITATPSPGGTYNYVWTVPSGAANPGNVASFSATVAGTYTVVITNSTTGCTATGSGTLTVNTNPTVTVNSPVRCISGSSVTVTATPSPGGTYNYAWTVPSGATNPGNVANFSATVAGTYAVVITNSTTGCTATGSGTLTVSNNPTVTVTSATKCANEAAVTITATPSPVGTYNYSWTVPSGVTNPGNVASFSASVAGTYTVIITDPISSCTGTGSGTLTVNQNPTVTVNSPIKCTSSSAVTISATPSPGGTYNYAWTAPSGVANPGNVASFSATVAGTYTVIITNTTTGCTATGSGTLTVNQNPTVTVNSASRCSNGNAVTITATPSPAGTYNYAWTVPAGATNPGSVASFSATVAGTYTVVITNSTPGCTATGSGTLTISNNPTVTVNSATKCANDPAVTITATPSPAGTYNYTWTVPAGATNPGNVSTFSGTIAGTYTVIITNPGSGCTATGSATLTVNPNPTVTIPDAFAINPGGLSNTVYLGYSPASSITLTSNITSGTPAYSYNWSSGSLSSSVTVSPVTNTTYSLTVTDANGCKSTATKNIIVKDIRSLSTVGNIILCHKTSAGTGTQHVDQSTVALHLAHGDLLGVCAAETLTELAIAAAPNPTKNYFIITVEGSNANEKIDVTISNSQGKIIEKRENLFTTSFSLGANYFPGVYYIQVFQGTRKASLSLIKQ